MTVEQSRKAEEKLARHIEGAREELGAPAISAGVVYGDGTTWALSVGQADVEAQIPSTPSAQFRIGSITKTFTATAAMILIQRGALELDAPAIEYLPELRALNANGHRLTAVTLRRLIEHRSGLSAEPPTRNWHEHHFPSIEEVLAHIDAAAIAAPPGTPKYSNLGYALIGEIIARASSMPYMQFVSREILQPLELDHTTFAPLDQEGACAAGYCGSASDMRVQVLPDLGAETPGGQLYSTAPDLLRWLGFHLGHVQSDILSDASLRRLHTPECAGDDELGSARSIGWDLWRRGEWVIHEHSGGVDGFTSTVSFDRRARVGAVMLTNAERFPFEHGIGLLDLAHKLGPAAAALRQSTATTAADRSLIGSYEGPLNLDLTVSEQGGELVAGGGLIDHPGAILAPSGPDAYIVAAGRFAGETLTVKRDAGRAVSGLCVAKWLFPRVDTP